MERVKHISVNIYYTVLTLYLCTLITKQVVQCIWITLVSTGVLVGVFFVFEEPEYLEETSMSDLMTTRQYHMPTPDIELDSQLYT